MPPPAFPSLLESTLKAHRVASRRVAHSLSILPHGLVTLLMPMEGWTPSSPSHPPIFRRPTLFLAPPFLSQRRFQGWTVETRPKRHFCNPPFRAEVEKYREEERKLDGKRERESAGKGESLGSHFSRPPHDRTPPKELHFLLNPLNLSSLFSYRFFFHFCSDSLLLSCSFPSALSVRFL